MVRYLANSCCHGVSEIPEISWEIGTDLAWGFVEKELSETSGCYLRNIEKDSLRVSLSPTKTLLVNLQGLNFGIERRLRNPELSCSSSRTGHPAITLRERRLDHLPFLGGKLLGKRLNRRLGSPRRSREPAFIDAQTL